MCLCSPTTYGNSWVPVNAKTDPKEERISVTMQCWKCSFLGENKRDTCKGAHCCDSYCHVTGQLLKPAVERSALCTLLWKFSTITPSQIHRTSAGRENGCDAYSSSTLASQMQALKNWCCQQPVNKRGIRNGSSLPIPWQVPPFHTMFSSPLSKVTELCVNIREPPGRGTDTSSRTNICLPCRGSSFVTLWRVQRQVLEVSRLQLIATTFSDSTRTQAQ